MGLRHLSHQRARSCGRRHRPRGEPRDGSGMSLTGPFTLQRGLDAGLTERVLRGPAYRRLLHGVYAPVGSHTDHDGSGPRGPAAGTRWCCCWLATPPRPSGEAVVPTSPDIQLGLPPGSRLRVSGVDARVRRRPDAVVHHGLPMTSPAQTFLDLAGDLDLVDMVVVGDSLVRAGVATPEELVAASCRIPREAGPIGPASRRIRAGRCRLAHGVSPPDAPHPRRPT